MLDFHMEREHGKRQADALLLNRKGMDAPHDKCSFHGYFRPFSSLDEFMKSNKDIESRMYGARDKSTSRAADDDDADNNNTSSLAARRAAARQATPKYEPIETKKIECPECGQKFVSERAMNIHLSTMHEKTTKVPKVGCVFLMVAVPMLLHAERTEWPPGIRTPLY